MNDIELNEMILSYLFKHLTISFFSSLSLSLFNLNFKSPTIWYFTKLEKCFETNQKFGWDEMRDEVWNEMVRWLMKWERDEKWKLIISFTISSTISPLTINYQPSYHLIIYHLPSHLIYHLISQPHRHDIS